MPDRTIQNIPTFVEVKDGKLVFNKTDNPLLNAIANFIKQKEENNPLRSIR